MLTIPHAQPYKVDTDVGLVRGVQLGYNICNSTTVGPNSLCQTGWLNAVDGTSFSSASYTSDPNLMSLCLVDFCLWAPPTVGAIGDTERLEVAWCTKSGRGTRLIPDGTLQGVHFVKTPDYVQVTGQGDFTKINVPKGDAGGEVSKKCHL